MRRVAIAENRGRVRRRRTVRQQRARFFQDQPGDIARRRRLPAPRVNLDLRLDRNRLIGRQRIDREKPRRMAGEPVDRHHFDPVVDGLGMRQQKAPQRAKLAQRVLMIKGEKIAALQLSRAPVDFAQARFDRRERGRREARARKQRGQRIYVVADGPASLQRRLQRRRAAPHERVVDALARRGEARDEKLGQLRLETGAIADLMQRMRLALAGGPEFIDEIGNAVLLELNRLGAKGVEAAQFGEEGVAVRRRDGGGEICHDECGLAKRREPSSDPASRGHLLP